MRIISIQIESFGMLEDRSFSFAPGMNILEGHNESGKSTLLAFIKFIFYGASNRAVGESMSERTRRLNWKTGRAAGSMTIETAAGRYRIERSLARTVSGSVESSRESYTESLQIVDLESGTPLPRGTQPGEYFLGVPAAVFESTAYVRQLGSTGVDGTGVSEALENLLTSASESSNTTRALARLDTARKALLHKNGRGGEIYTLQTERSAVIGRLERAKTAGSERIAAQTLLDGLQKSAAESREKLSRLNARCDACDALMLLRRFESLHALEQKTAELRTALARLHESEGADGFLPDRIYAARLRELERSTAAADAECARCETELARMRFEQPGDPNMAAQAAEIRTAGGIDALTERYHTLDRTARRLRIAAILCLVLGGLCLVGGLAVGLLWHKAGFFAAAAALPCLAAGIACLTVSSRRRGALDALCRRFGLPGAGEETIFVNRLAACFEEEDQLTGYAEVLAQIEADLETKQRTLDALRREAIDTLARWNITVRDGGLAEILSQAIPRAERVADTAEELNRDLAKYESVWQSTTAELEAHDEAQLRRRVDAAGIDPAELNITALRRERDFCAKGLEAIEYKRIETEKQLIALDATTEDPIKLAAKVEELDRRIDALTARCDAIRLAEEALTDAAESLRRGVIPRLRARAGELLSAITNGRYDGIGIGRGMALSVEEEDTTHPVEALSSGTGDAAYLALRIALLELLFVSEQPPLLLDESLSQLDDTRAAALLALLTERCAEGEQCILFTCHGREAGLVESEHILL